MNEETKERIAAINSGIIPEGYKKTKVGIVPVEWETTSLGNYIIEHTEKSTENNQYPVLTSSRRGIFLQSDYYNKQVASEDNTGYNVVPFGYFTYRHMSDDEIFRFNINNIVEKGIVSTLYPVFTTHNLDDNWLLNTLNNGHEFQKYALIQKQGGSRTYMYLEKLKKLKLAIPPLPEQQKIAEILSTQDKLIELQEKKIEQLKELKKAYLQKMFPKKGSKYPELRFKGFTVPWKQRKLGECVTITSGEAPSKFKHGSVNYVKVDDLNYAYKTVVDTQNKVSDNPSMSKVKVGSVIFPKRGAAILTNKVRILGVESYMDTNMMALTATSLDSDFLYVLISKEGLYKIADTSTIPQINNKHIEPYEVIVPTLDEQKRIGELFAHLDSLITLHQRKSEQEKQKKKALMQLLLTGKVRCI